MAKKFIVRKSKEDNGLIIQTSLQDLLGMYYGMIKTLNLADMVEDDNYVVRIGQNGLFEVGYPSDQWRLK